MKEFHCKKCGACFASSNPKCTACKSTDVNEITTHGTVEDYETKEVKPIKPTLAPGKLVREGKKS